MEKSLCPMCEDGKVISKTFKELYKMDEVNHLLDTPNFYVVPDNYPVVGNHILIIPKKHYVSYSQIENDKSNELQAIIKTIKEITGNSQFALFEHGSNMVGIEQKACGNSVFHAHLHFIPKVQLDREQIIEKCSSGLEEQKIELIEGQTFDKCTKCKTTGKNVLDFLKEDLPTTGPYLFCSYSNLTGATLCIPDELIVGHSAPSQFFRRVFAEICNPDIENPFFNWKDAEQIRLSHEIRGQRIKATREIFADKAKTFSIFYKNLEKINFKQQNIRE